MEARSRLRSSRRTRKLVGPRDRRWCTREGDGSAADADVLAVVAVVAARSDATTPFGGVRGWRARSAGGETGGRRVGARATRSRSQVCCAACASRLLLPLLVLAFAAVVSGCGGGQRQRRLERSAQRGRADLQRALRRLPHLRRRDTRRAPPRTSSGQERKDGPNFNQRKEQYEDVLYAIQNGGFSSGPMPQNIVVGDEAEGRRLLRGHVLGPGRRPGPEPGRRHGDLRRRPTDCKDAAAELGERVLDVKAIRRDPEPVLRRTRAPR